MISRIYFDRCPNILHLPSIQALGTSCHAFKQHSERASASIRDKAIK